MSEALSFRDTIVPKSDQLNADDLVAGPLDGVIASVSRNASPEQPMSIHLVGYDRPYKPCKGMRRLLLDLWGDTAAEWKGRRIRIYRNQDVTWAGEAVGGIRIDGLSHIQGNASVPVTVSRGKKLKQRVEKLAVERARTQSVPPTDPDPDLTAFRHAIGDAMRRTENPWSKEQIAFALESVNAKTAADVPADKRAAVLDALKDAPPNLSTSTDESV